MERIKGTLRCIMARQEQIGILTSEVSDRVTDTKRFQQDSCNALLVAVDNLVFGIRLEINELNSK
jgi:hypothetical protein